MTDDEFDELSEGRRNAEEERHLAGDRGPIKLNWSAHATVALPAKEEGQPPRMGNAFQLLTFAVRADFPDGTSKVRLLKPGIASDNPDLPNDAEFAAALIEEFKLQTEAVIFEGDL